MTVNQYFNNYKAVNEQNLYEGMIIESIQMKGLDVVYFERSQPNIDYLYREDPDSIFKESDNKIEMFPAFVDGFEGEISFGRHDIEFAQTATFIVSKKRFLEEFPTLKVPKEGDLIFMPITNAILEIKYVNPESPFFEKGKQYVWEVKAELFVYSHEEIDVNDQEAEDAMDDMELEEFFEGSYTDFDDNGDKTAINSEIEDDAEDLIVNNPNNPFGVR